MRQEVSRCHLRQVESNATPPTGQRVTAGLMMDVPKRHQAVILAFCLSQEAVVAVMIILCFDDT